ncbi:MAG: rRNA pseudouridine synthase, partial [Clostridia bacterium]|nr:rRNA pseudouridine synthase [Clostridia bacterium]
ANAMMHPSRHVPKTYRVTVRPDIDEDQITKLTTGVIIDGKKTAEAQVQVLTKEPGRVVLQMIIYEGRNREIRKMCEEVGLEVARLKRTAIGSIKLGMLPQGQYRNLTEDEVHKLMTSSGAIKKA